MENKTMEKLLDELVLMLEHDENSKTQYVIKNKKKFWKLITQIGDLSDEHRRLGDWGKDY